MQSTLNESIAAGLGGLAFLPDEERTDVEGRFREAQGRLQEARHRAGLSAPGPSMNQGSTGMMT